MAQLSGRRKRSAHHRDEHCHFPCSERSALAIARTKSTTLGPHREATESSTLTIVPVRTAAMLLQAGRPETVARGCPQQTESASTITSGSAATTSSDDSCG